MKTIRFWILLGFQRFVKKSCEFFQPKGVGSKQEEMTCQAEHATDKFHLRFVAVKRKQEVQSGQTFWGFWLCCLVVCVKRETCKTETVLD